MTRAAPRVLGIAGLLAGLVVVMLVSVAVGARPIPLGTVVEQILHPDRTPEGIVVHDLRIPRTLLGVMVGAALGVAGALMQALTRNPLADPGLLGVNAGAAAAVVLAMVVLGTTAPAAYVWFALLGALAALLLAHALGARGHGVGTPARLALAGMAVSAALAALVAAVILLRPTVFDQFREWELGSLSGRGQGIAATVAPFVGVGLLVAVALGRPLNAIALGEETGRALGAHIGRIRAAGALAVALLCGAATAAAGPIGFIGLVVPHMARVICGPDQRWILAYAAVLAPTLLLGADVIGRVVDRPGEVQVGVVTALLGAPAFIALVRRRRLVRL